MIPSDHKHGILKPRFFGCVFEEFTQGDVGVGNGMLHGASVSRQFSLIGFWNGVGVVGRQGKNGGKDRFFAIAKGVHAPNEMLQIGFVEYAPVAIKVAPIQRLRILVDPLILLQARLFEKRLKSHGAVIGAMKKGGFISFGELKGVVDFVAGVCRGDIKLTHEAGHSAENAGHHFDAFGAVGIAIGEIEGAGVGSEFVEVGCKRSAIPKTSIIAGEAFNDYENDVGLNPATALTARHRKWRQGL